MNKMWIIIKEVYRKNVMSASFLFMVLGPILMIGAIAGVSYLIGTSKANDSVGTVAVINAPANVQSVLTSGEVKNEYQFKFTEPEAEKALINKEIDGYLVLTNQNNQLSGQYYRMSTSKDIDVSAISDQLKNYQYQVNAQQLGVDLATVAALNATNVSIDKVEVTAGKDGNISKDSKSDIEKGIRSGVAYAVCFIVYLFVMNYVGIISQEIATEKGSRIMEIVLSSISPIRHFFGKMIGIGLVILTQIVTYVVLFFVGKYAVQYFHLLDKLSFLPESFNIVQILGKYHNDIMIGLVYALAGILTYTVLAGFLGSLVSRTEDVNKTITPLVLVGVVGLYIGMYALTSTNNSIVRISSHIPFFTPFVMPFRIAAETVGNFEIILSMVISLLFMIFCLIISSVFYKSNVLVTSDKGMIQTMKRSIQLWKSEKERK